MKIAKDKIDQWFERMQRGYQIVGPVCDGNNIEFKEILKFAEVDANAMATTMSAKGCLYPQCRKLLSVAREGDAYKIDTELPEKQDILLFGVRPCDAQALKVLDANFLRDDFEDSAYKTRREQTAIIAIACNDPLATCFCTSVGGSPADSEVADIILTDIGDFYFAEPKTKLGEELVMMASDVFVDAEDADKQQAQHLHEQVVAKLPARFDYHDVAKELEALFESPHWKEIAERCLSCGYCTFTCPTCYCFDVTDEKHGDCNAERLACWDACMFYGFTRMAGGHNPRNEKNRRYRQRAYHKFRYFVVNKGFPACVGCGRCSQSCPVGIDIAKVIQEAVEKVER